MRRAVLTVFAAILIYSTFVLLSDAREFAGAMAAFDARWLPALLGLPLVNYFLRFLKWQYLLGRTGVGLSRGRSLQVFLAGFSMTVSPGKFGEVLKSCLLRDREGIPVSLTSPVVVAERITDLMGMIVLALCGAAAAGGSGVLPVVASGAAFCILGVIVLSSRRAFSVISGALCRLRFFSTRRDAMCTFRETSARLLDARSLLVCVPLSIVSWGAEAMVLAAAAASIGYRLPAGLSLLAHSAGTIAGAVSMIPGGLGLTELTIGGLLSPSMGRSGAAAATILMRFATLWFAVVIGLVALSSQRRRPATASGEGTADGCDCSFRLHSGGDTVEKGVCREGAGGKALYARNPDIVLREEDEDGALLFNPDTSEVRVLNATGLYIWRRCGGAPMDELLAAVSDAFEDVPEERVRSDVENFVSGLLEAGFMGMLDAGEGRTR